MPASSEAVDLRSSSNRGGKKNKKDEEPAPEPGVSYGSTYQLQAGETASDPLFRFSVATTEDLILLESDPNIGTWGSDFFGYWSEPFAYSDGQVTYTIGLNDYTYIFSDLPDGRVEVTLVHVQRPYLSGETTTTTSRVGTFTLTP